MVTALLGREWDSVYEEGDKGTGWALLQVWPQLRESHLLDRRAERQSPAWPELLWEMSMVK